MYPGRRESSRHISSRANRSVPEINLTRLGVEEEVLIEGKTDKTDFPFYGRTRFQAPEIDGITYVRARKLTAGDIVRCKITAAEIYDLYAEKAGD